jgi:hypothetical protein
MHACVGSLAWGEEGVVLGVERAVLGLDNGPLVRHLARRVLNVLVREVGVVPRRDSAKPAACDFEQKGITCVVR